MSLTSTFTGHAVNTLNYKCKSKHNMCIGRLTDRWDTRMVKSVNKLYTIKETPKQIHIHKHIYCMYR